MEAKCLPFPYIPQVPLLVNVWIKKSKLIMMQGSVLFRGLLDVRVSQIRHLSESSYNVLCPFKLLPLAVSPSLPHPPSPDSTKNLVPRGTGMDASRDGEGE